MHGATEQADKPQYMRTKAAAAYAKEQYGIGSVRWLAGLRVSGKGPEFHLIGMHPVYTRAAIDDFMRSRLSRPIRSTTEAAALRAA